MSRIVRPFGDQPDYAVEELRDCVRVQNGPPCLIVETMGDEAVIRSIITGEQWMVEKKSLKDCKYYVR